MNSYGMRKRFLARMLALGMVVSLCPAGNVFAAAAETASVDMKVADRIYGWVTDAPVNNGNGSVTLGIVPAGQSQAKSYTTEKIYNMTNENLEGMDGVDEADVLLVRLGYEVSRSGDMSFQPGVFAELCLNEEGKVIDARRVLQSGLFFDTAEYGGDLTKIGSTVEHRGVEGTGIMTGEAGDMVASGWVLAKGDSTLTLGDGNMATELFIEQYSVAKDAKVYEVDNDTYASSEKTFADIPVTPSKDGVIYDTASEQRMFAVAVFDKDYTAYDSGSAKVSEIYYF